MQNREAVQKRGAEVGAVDSFNLAGIFGLFLSEESKLLLENTLKFVMFPLAALGSGIQAFLAWRQYRIDRQQSSLGRAGIEIVSALAITTAVVGALAFHSLFVLAAPVIFTAVTGFKALFHFGAACYNLGKYALTGDPQYASAAGTHAVGTVTMGLTAAAVGLVMIAAKPIYAILGVAAGLIGGIFSLYKRCTAPKPVGTADMRARLLDAESDSTREEVSEEISPSAKMQNTFAPKQGNNSNGKPPVHPNGKTKFGAKKEVIRQKTTTSLLFDPSPIEVPQGEKGSLNPSSSFRQQFGDL